MTPATLLHASQRRGLRDGTPAMADPANLGGVLLLRGKPRPWWEGLDGKIRRGARIEIPKAALRAYGTEHWDGRRDVTVVAPALKIVTTVNEERETTDG